MTAHRLKDDEGTFDVTVLGGERPSHAVLFAVGAGGNPERHLPLLEALAERGCIVVAPHFERIVVPSPTEEELVRRARRLRFSLESFVRAPLPIAGVGHSIGAMLLVALAGGQAWMRVGHRLVVDREPRLERLALLAPATGYFQAPGALSDVRTPMIAWAGTNDGITPPAQAAFLKHALEGRVDVDLRVEEGAGHFSFMNALPPHVTDPIADREAFLARVASEIGRFVVG